MLFDLDGTLVHTDYRHREIVVGNTLAGFGKSASHEDIDKFWFEGGRDKIIKDVFGVNPSEFWDIYRNFDTVSLRKKYTRPYDDTNSIVWLRNRGYKTGIVTSAPLEMSELESKMIGKDLFDCIIVAHIDNGFQPKPSPQGIYECLEKLGVGKKDAFFVGNSDEDVYASRNAGVIDIFVDRGEHKFADLYPTIVIESLDLLKYIVRL